MGPRNNNAYRKLSLGKRQTDCYYMLLMGFEKQAGNKSNIKIEEIVAISDNLQKYRSISTKQHRLLLLECSN